MEERACGATPRAPRSPLPLLNFLQHFGQALPKFSTVHHPLQLSDTPLDTVPHSFAIIELAGTQFKVTHVRTAMCI
jgi:hypothetical protein